MHGYVGRRDIVLCRQGFSTSAEAEVFDNVPVIHSSYDSLSYVLLRSFEKDDCHIQMTASSSGTGLENIVHKISKIITPTMFYCYRLFMRSNEINTLHQGGQLFQQYIVDHYCKVESERLSYLRQIQQRLSAADYTSLYEQLGNLEHLNKKAEVARAGRSIIMPSTHYGGDRYTRQDTHDIIAAFNGLDHPDIF